MNVIKLPARCPVQITLTAEEAVKFHEELAALLPPPPPLTTKDTTYPVTRKLFDSVYENILV